MAKVWYIWGVTLLLSTYLVLTTARDCSEIEEISNCNECIRCGGRWCKDPKQNYQCTNTGSDDWCPDHQENIILQEDIEEIGDLLNPRYSERTALVQKMNTLTINYKSSSKPLVDVRIVNTTQNNEFQAVHSSTNCANGECKTDIGAYPSDSFCSTTGRVSEFVHVKVKIEGLSEETSVKYRVPCACECSEKTQKYSKACSGNGDFSCGHCYCYDGWTGKHCEKRKCAAKRGDVPCSHPLRDNVECSGNGKCDACETCVCYTDRVGSQYFDKDNFCADICMTTNECEDCLRNPTLGKCSLCSFPLIYQNYNHTLVKQRDHLNRSVWIMCNETFADGYHVEYYATRIEWTEIYFMIPPDDAVNAAIGGGAVSVTLPIILGLVAVVAAGAAVAGYMVWKNRLPPVPLNDPMYTNIGAEDSTGENPLYKPPTSSFKNPTYGKW